MKLGFGLGLPFVVKAPSGGGGGSTTDQYFGAVSTLLHFNGGLTDSTGKTWTAFGDAAATGTAYLGSNALQLDGVGDYISTPDTQDFTLGAADWTVEFWAYATGAVLGFMCGQYESSTDRSFHIHNNSASNTVVVSIRRHNGTSASITSNTNALPNNTWTHIAVERFGDTVTMYINGTAQTTTTTMASAHVTDCSGVFKIGGDPVANGYFSGRMDEFRLTNGVARYQGDFSVQTREFYDSQTEGYDPFFSHVQALLHLDTGTTTITDVIGNTWTAYGNATANGLAKFGDYGLALDGSGDYVNTPSSTNFNIGYRDFTAEAWVRLTANPSTGFTAIFGRHTGAVQGWLLCVNPSRNLNLYLGSGFQILGGAPALTLNTYSHVAVSRKAGVWRIYVDGTSVGSYTDNSSYDIANPLQVGMFPSNGAITGQVDDFRFTTTYGRYGANFTPPATVFLDQ